MTAPGPEINTEIRQGVFVNSAYSSLLSENSLASFDSFLSIQQDKVIKKVRDDRQTVRVKLVREGQPASGYLKLSFYSWLANLFKTMRKFTRQRGSLVHEYHNLVRLREVGVPSITPIAAGTRVRGLRCESFLLTEDLGPTKKLEDYVPEEFDKPFSPGQAKRKKMLVEALARLTRLMHEGGVNHRDYYLCHIHILPGGEAGSSGATTPDSGQNNASTGLGKTPGSAEEKPHSASPGSGADSVRWQDKDSTGNGKTMQSGKEKAHTASPGSGWPELFVIDLNRADRRARIGLRWIVKDLAALNYSAPAHIFSRADRLRFLKSYLGAERLNRAHHRLVRKILKKTAGIARHAVRSKARDLRYMAGAKSSSHRRDAEKPCSHHRGTENTGKN
jgi:hypothetical protein